ncbi:MAG TPA: DUF1648 domain-containing protein [Pyrinomonadaceae bacterium]|nr:DUF1648 domain-containing protein [Pyrinomonadaceae bacterium]
MTQTQVVTLVMLASNAVTLGVFLWLPVMRGERAFFGARVDRETYLGGEGRRTLRHYRLTLTAVFVIITALGYFLAARHDEPLLLAPSAIGTAFAGLFVYAAYARSLRPFAVQTTATRFASPLRTRRLADYTHAWLEALIILASAGTFAALLYFYPRLPEQVPVHWDAAGRPDDWAAKGFASVFFVPALGLYLQLFFLVLKYDLTGAKMTLPDAHAEEYLRGKEQFLLANIRVLDWARVWIAVLFALIALMAITTSLPEFSRYDLWLNVATGATAGLMLAGIFYFIYRMMRVNADLGARFGEDYVLRASDEQHWRHGGLTYHNPEDPALVVEKLVGLGYTINTAHPAAPKRLLLLAGIPAFVIWAIIAL